MSDFHTGMGMALEAERQHDEERRELAQLRAQLAEARAVLKEHLLTTGPSGRVVCDVCEWLVFEPGQEKEGHAPDCRLAKILTS